MPQRCKCPNLNGEYFSCKKASFSSEHFEGMVSPRALVRGNPTQASFTAENTDVSLHGLGAQLGIHRFSGRWSPTQQQNHINTLSHIGSSLLHCQWVPEQATLQSSSLDVRQRHTNIIYQAGRLWTRSFRLTWLSGYSSFATTRGYYWFLYTYRAVATFRWTVCHDR